MEMDAIEMEAMLVSLDGDIMLRFIKPFLPPLELLPAPDSLSRLILATSLP